MRYRIHLASNGNAFGGLGGLGGLLNSDEREVCSLDLVCVSILSRLLSRAHATALAIYFNMV